MAERREPVERALEDLSAEAESERIEIDQSFFTELRNYARHEKVEELDDEILRDVVRSLGKEAMHREPGRRAGGGDVRKVTFELCGDPFGDCSEAAAKLSEAAADALKKREKEQGAAGAKNVEKR